MADHAGFNCVGPVGQLLEVALILRKIDILRMYWGMIPIVFV
jgi:hypothetical protein